VTITKEGDKDKGGDRQFEWVCHDCNCEFECGRDEVSRNRACLWYEVDCPWCGTKLTKSYRDE